VTLRPNNEKRRKEGKEGERENKKKQRDKASKLRFQLAQGY
jgi:hypothetical protein